MKKNGYVGRIKNQGTQQVKAPCGSAGGSKGNSRITGTDLRTGTKGK